MSLFPDMEKSKPPGNGEPAPKSPPAGRGAGKAGRAAKGAPQPPPAGYLALARKYRPGAFDEVVGQDAVIGTLRNAIQSGRLHHAYLFSGIRGVGKTTIARLFARALNCVEGPTPTPCNQCDPCREIAAGQSMDVIELDAASNRGVDDVEPLREAARYAPSRDRNKVFILDEAHMLSNAAFNSLLKILEEPPPRIVWILATTEYRKVPPTVVSRCQHFEFHRVPRPVVTAYLERIAKAEKVKVEPEGLEIIAATSGGSVRDAVSLLDQAIAYSGAKASAEDVRNAIGVIDRRQLSAFLRLVAAGDAAALLDHIAGLAEGGTDFSQFAAGLVATVRDATVLRFSPGETRAVAVTGDEARELREMAGAFSEDGLLRLFNAILDLPGSLRGAPQPRFALEAAALRLTRLADLTPIEEVIRELRSGGGAPPAAPSGPAAAGGGGRGPAGGGAPSGGGSFSSRLGFDTKSRKAAPPAAAASPSPLPPAPRPAPPPVPPAGAGAGGNGAGPGAPLTAEERTRLMEAVQARKISMRTFLEGAREIRAAGDRLRVVFSPKQVFFRQSLSTPESQALLAEAAAEAIGRALSVEVIAGEAGKANGAAAAPAASGGQRRREDLIQEAMKRPQIKLVMDAFRGQIVNIRDLT